MARFKHGTVEIAYLDEGVGDAIVLVHGFASTKEVNWLHPGWSALAFFLGAQCLLTQARQSVPSIGGRTRFAN